MLDLNRPVQFRNGIPCRIICSNRVSDIGRNLVALYQKK